MKNRDIIGLVCGVAFLSFYVGAWAEYRKLKNEASKIPSKTVFEIVREYQNSINEDEAE